MSTVSMLDFRKNGRAILQRVIRGQRIVLTYRGKPVAQLVPVSDPSPSQEDPFYSLHRLADLGGESLTNQEMDEIVYDHFRVAGFSPLLG